MKGALLLAAALVPLTAAAQPASLTLDDIRARPSGEHRVLVSVLDAAGTPVPGLEQAFEVQVDGRPVRDLVVAPTRTGGSRSTLTLVIDGALLSGSTLGGVQDAVRAVAGRLATGERLRIVVAGESVRAIESGAPDAAALAGQLEALANSSQPRIYDALHDAARHAASAPEADGAAVLLVTRGADGGSARSLIEVLALARSRARLVPVFVTLIGDHGASGEGERLQRLAVHTAGAAGRVTSTADLASALAAQVGRGLERWRLEFLAPEWSRDVDAHQLRVIVAQGPDARRAEMTYRTADVLPRASLASWLPWVLVAVAMVVGVGAWLGLRRRQRGLLVHDGDEDDGVWYELFGLPVSLGGSEGNDIVVADPHVSRHHAVMEARGRQVELVDLNSENGTYVNGERISRRVLADGDRIGLGPDVALIYEARG